MPWAAPRLAAARPRPGLNDNDPNGPAATSPGAAAGHRRPNSSMTTTSSTRERPAGLRAASQCPSSRERPSGARPAPAEGIARSANSRKESLNALSDADNAYLIELMLEREPTRIKGRFDRYPGIL